MFFLLRLILKLKIQKSLTLLIIAAGLVFITTNNTAASTGECALDFLNIPIGAYSASTGQANYSGLVGPQAIFRNPSLIGNQSGVFFSYQELLLDTRSQTIAANLAVSERHSFGIGLNIFDIGKIDGYNEIGESTGKIDANDFAAKIGYSYNSQLSLGISLSYYREKLDNYIGQGLAFGFGISLTKGPGRLSLTADNLGPNFKAENSSAPLPARVSISGWLPLQDFYSNINMDLTYSREYGYRLSAGIEYSPIDKFFLRAGSGFNNTISAGFGLNIERIDLDYAFLPSDNFGDRHIFSITIIK